MTPHQARREALFAEVPDHDWNNWRWQQQHRLRTVEDLQPLVPMTADEAAATRVLSDRFRMAVTPYYLTLIDPDDPQDPIRRQCFPSSEELVVQPWEEPDPLAEEAHTVAPGLTHRYPDRVMFYVSHNCPVYCRHCFRKRKVSYPDSAQPREDLDEGIAYIRQHPEVRDVLVSGGDPLTFSNARLGALLSAIRAVPHVEIIRLATRNPVTLPQRVDRELCDMLSGLQPIYVNTHFNHPNEGTEEAAAALGLLADAGCVVSNQMVLLRGINDRPEVVIALNRWLLRHRCRPYYMFQCDGTVGLSHFRTPIEAGVEIIDALRGWTSGLMVPHYVVDLTGGGGKVPVQPDYIQSRDGDRWYFRNYRGDPFTYVAR